jgi:dTDP-glucose pyrophosphorylase
MPTTDLALVILAGGLGSRFGGAKQIEPFGHEGHFLFEYACYDAMRAGFEKVFIIVRPGMQDVIRKQLNRWMHSNRFDILAQEQNRSKPWGTAHALHFLHGKWEGSFLVLNADDYYGSGICQSAADLAQNGVQAAALLFELAPTLSPNGPVARGLCNIENHYLLGIEEVLQIEYKGNEIKDESQRTLSPAALISMNAWLLPPLFLTHLKVLVEQFLIANADNETAEIYLPKVINEMIAAGKLAVQVREMPPKWFGLTYADDLTEAKSQILTLEGKEYSLVFPTWI